MSDRQKFDSEDAVPVAKELIEMLRPFTEKIEIAGSLRRCRDRVSDIEILYIPRYELRQSDMFAQEPVDLAGEFLGKLLRDQVLIKRPNVNGAFTWGPKNKLTVHVESGIPVDFFSSTRENWWVSLVVRTGSKETNLKLTTGAQKRGASLMAYGCGVKWSDGTITTATSEEHVFDLCGVEYKYPNER